jgi:uncharacterized phage protein (TIGR01671 family)
MRERKFRAWDGNRMVYDGDKWFPPYFNNELKAITGTVIVTHKGFYFWVHETQLSKATEEYFDHASIRRPEIFEPMQFTGLHDRNGKEIWEGDILKLSYDDGKVKFIEVRFQDGAFIVEDDFYDYDMTAIGWALKEWGCNGDKVEVIGTRFENPELLNHERPGDNRE